MRFQTIVIAFLVLVTSSCHADWRSDSRGIRRLTTISATLCSGLKSFAQSNQGADEISGESHGKLEKAVADYVRIRNLLGAIEHRWSKVALDDSEIAKGRVLAATLSLAASSLIMHNSKCLLTSFEGTVFENRLNRPIVFRGEVCAKDLLAEVHAKINSLRWRKSVQKRLKVLAKFESEARELAQEKGEVLQFLIGAISLDDVAQEGKLSRLGRALLAKKESLAHGLKKGLTKSFEFIVSVLSKPTVKIKVRKPHIRDEKMNNVINELKGLLKPCDVFLHKTAYQANDWMIPGYFSHAGMWLGSLDEMRELGLFSKSKNQFSYFEVMKNKERLESGCSLLEGLFTDTAVNDFTGYMLPCDVIAVLRPKTGVVENPGEVICKAMRHVGQVYDFGFDVNTYDTIVCSELIYQAYPSNIPWPTKKRLGRPTFSPDNIGTLAGPTSAFPFEVVYFHDGQRAYRDAEAQEVYWRAFGPKADLPKPDSEANRQIIEAIDQLDFAR